MEKTFKDENLEIDVLSKMVNNPKSAILSMDLLNENYFTTYLTKEVFNIVKNALKSNIKLDVILLSSELEKKGFGVNDFTKFLNDPFIDRDWETLLWLDML